MTGLSSVATMAQTKRKRRSKHRGNAAGIVEARGRTGRRPTAPAEQKKADRARPRASARMNKPPTWNSAFLKAALMAGAAVRLHADRPVRRRHDDRAVARSSALFALLLYMPLAYFDRQLRLPARPEAQARKQRGLMDVRCLTVGLVQENTWIVRRDGSDTRRCWSIPATRPSASRPRSTTSASRPSRRSCSRTRTSTTSAPSRRWRRRPARRSTARSSRSPVLADIMAYVPWPGLRPVRVLRRRRDARGRRAARARRPRDRRALHARPLPGPRDLLDPRRAARCSPATCCSRARSAAPTCPAATTRTLLQLDRRRCSTRCPTRPRVLPGPHGRRRRSARERADQPVPARARRA